MMNMAVVGCGLVGGSWALVFARAGHRVAMYDPSPTAVEAALALVESAAAALAPHGLLNGRSVADVLALLRPTHNLADAVGEADYVQESVPEQLAIKQALYEAMAPLARERAILASSTSGLPASAFTAGIAGRQRCLVVHPVNPPHLLPLVELVPAPWTAPEVVDQAEALMRQLGQAPIRLNREIDGFVLNRLQSAVLAEAFRLVEDGICGAADVDLAMTEGLGPRWFFLGPFETIDLNAQGGLADYCAKLGPMYHGLARQQADPRQWNAALVAGLQAARRDAVPEDRLAARKTWRDRCLAALIAARRAVLAAEPF